MKAIVMRAAGGIEVLDYVELPNPVPDAGQVLVEIKVAGVNFMDIGIRQGMRNVPLPHTLGVEGAGRIIALGEGVNEFVVGQRVAWVYGPGSYAEQVVLPADSLVALPDNIDDRSAAALMMQGLTASHFATDFYAVRPGDVAFVHAAAGGVGQLLTQMIKLRGGSVIGRVSSQQKVGAARAAGVDHVIVDTAGSFSEEALHLTAGRGVDVVYDGSGPSTFQGSLDLLRSGGTFCWYGPVLGAPEQFSIMQLPRSIKIGYAVFFDHISTPALLREHARQLFDWFAEGRLKLFIGAEYPLHDAAHAHAEMESRRTTGKLLLVT